jgi:hypothetical protein
LLYLYITCYCQRYSRVWIYMIFWNSFIVIIVTQISYMVSVVRLAVKRKDKLATRQLVPLIDKKHIKSVESLIYKFNIHKMLNKIHNRIISHFCNCYVKDFKNQKTISKYHIYSYSWVRSPVYHTRDEHANHPCGLVL